MRLQEQYSSLKAELDSVDQLLLQRLSKAEEPLRTAAIQFAEAGGKRSRPLLCLIASRFGAGDPSPRYEMCVAIELVHMCSLIHDDIIDHARIRRGDEAIHQKYTKQIATYVGDYLVAEALDIMTDINLPDVHQLFSNTLKHLAMGELAQYKNRYQMNTSLKAYLKKNRNKTARLIARSAQLGAIATNASATIQNNLYSIGYCLGMSYQIIDDILDFVAKDGELGKASGQDLRSGYLTLPTLLAIEDDQIYQKLHSVYKQSQNERKLDFEQLIADIKGTDAIQRSYQYSQWYLDRALKEIKLLPDQTEKSILYQLVGYLSKRTY